MQMIVLFYCKLLDIYSKESDMSHHFPRVHKLSLNLESERKKLAVDIFNVLINNFKLMNMGRLIL